MKYISILLGVTVVFFSGCSTKGHYEYSNIGKNLKPFYNKVENQNINIVSHNEILKKSPTSTRGQASSIIMETGKINTQVTKEFLSQYFKNINISEVIVPNVYTIETKVIDYNYAYGFLDSTEMEIFLNVKLYKNDKTILDKSYKSKADNNVLLVFDSLVISGKAIELFHKQLLDIYENQVKQDLLKAMRNN